MSHATTLVSRDLAEVVRRLGDAVVAEAARARRGQIEGVHQARVMSRRLQEALDLVTARVPEAQAARRDARRLRRALGAVRELDVARRLLYEEARAHRWPAIAVAPVRRALAHLRDERRRASRHPLGRVHDARLAERLRLVVIALEFSPRRADLGRRLGSRVAHRAELFADRVRAIGPLYAPVPLHAVRIAAKKLRYSLELARDLRHLPIDREIDALAGLQDDLGRLHDLYVLGGHIRAVEADTEGRPVRDALAAVARRVEEECRRVHAEFLRAAPKWLALADRAGVLATGMRRPQVRRMTTPVASRLRVARGA